MLSILLLLGLSVTATAKIQGSSAWFYTDIECRQKEDNDKFKVYGKENGIGAEACWQNEIPQGGGQRRSVWLAPTEPGNYDTTVCLWLYKHGKCIEQNGFETTEVVVRKDRPTCWTYDPYFGADQFGYGGYWFEKGNCKDPPTKESTETIPEDYDPSA